MHFFGAGETQLSRISSVSQAVLNTELKYFIFAAFELRYENYHIFSYIINKLLNIFSSLLLS